MIIIQRSQNRAEPFGVIGGCYWTFDTNTNTQGPAHCWGISGAVARNSATGKQKLDTQQTLTEEQARAAAELEKRNAIPAGIMQNEWAKPIGIVVVLGLIAYGVRKIYK